jgi:ethanolamine utilization microcompartment shell protein EutL
MASTATNPSQQAHELIDRLAPSQVSAMVSLIETMLDPVSRASANSSVDDAPLTAECEKSLAEASDWLKHNQGIPHQQVLAELGITQEEIERFQAPK